MAARFLGASAGEPLWLKGPLTQLEQSPFGQGAATDSLRIDTSSFAAEAAISSMMVIS